MGLCGLSFSLIGLTATVEGDAKSRIKSDRLVKIRDCAIVVALAIVGGAAGGVLISNSRPQPNCLAEVGNRAVVFSLSLVGQTAIVVGDTITRIKSDRFVKVRHCAVVFAHAVKV